MAGSGENRSLSGAEKAAVFLLSVGPETASEVFKHLSGEEVRTLTRTMVKLQHIPPAQVAAVHNEFLRKMSNVDGLTVDGRQFARQALLRAIGDKEGGSEAHRQVLADLEAGSEEGGTAISRSLSGVAAETLAKFLENEHPQVASLVIANLDLKRASAVLAALPEAMQSEVVLRVAKLASVAPDALEEVRTILEEQLGEVARRESGRVVGGAKLAADLLNHADKALEGRVLQELESRDPELTDQIRQQMFTFEDLVQLDNRSMQVVLKEVAREDLMLALKTASEELKAKIFANVSSRAAEIIKEDMAAMGPVKLKDVEKAQRSIVEAVRQLEKEGKVVLAGGGGDVLV